MENPPAVISIRRKEPHAGHDLSASRGDLGNIEADSSGKAHLELTDKMMTMSGGIPSSVAD